MWIPVKKIIFQCVVRALESIHKSKIDISVFDTVISTVLTILLIQFYLSEYFIFKYLHVSTHYRSTKTLPILFSQWGSIYEHVISIHHGHNLQHHTTRRRPVMNDPPSSQGAFDSSMPSSADLTMFSGSGSEWRTMAPYRPYSAMIELRPHVFSDLRHLARRFWNHTYNHNHGYRA